MKKDTRQFLLLFILTWVGFCAELAWLHVRVAPAPVAYVQHAVLQIDLDPRAGRARVSALLDLGAPAGASLDAVALVLPAAAERVRVQDAEGRTVRGRWRSHERIYLERRPGPGGRVWDLQKYSEPRLDLHPRPDAAARLGVAYELDGARLRAPSSLRPGRSLLLGAWLPRLETVRGSPAPRFTYRLQVRSPAGEPAVASAHLEGRRAEGEREISDWRSVWPAADVWILSAPLEEVSEERRGRGVHVYVERGRAASLAPQIASDALDVWEAIETWAGPRQGAEWHLATVDRLGAIGRGQPPLVLFDAGLLRRPAERPASRLEHRNWIAQEMARAWMRVPPATPAQDSADALVDAQGAVLAEIALSGPPGGGPSAVVADDAERSARPRVEWMMRCRAYAQESAPHPPLDDDGRPVTGLLAATKLPAVLDTIAAQMGDESFVSLATRETGGDFMHRLDQAAGGRALSALLTQEWLPDLSVESAEASADGVLVHIADRGHGVVPLKVAVLLETPQGARRLEWTVLPPGGSAEARFAGARGWRRVEVDPQRRVFQVEYANDALPRETNPWLALEKVWDARRWIARGEFQRALEDGKAAARLDPELREADYWIGFALIKMGRGAEAARWLERARAGPVLSDVVAAESLYLLGQAYEATGRREEARALYRQVVEEDWTSFSVDRARQALAVLEAAAVPAAR